jgi:hypothetical protein
MKNIMVYDFAQQFINESHYVYEYKCSFDPTGNRLGCLHYIRRKKPQSPRDELFEYWEKKYGASISHITTQKKYQEQMKKKENSNPGQMEEYIV